MPKTVLARFSLCLPTCVHSFPPYPSPVHNPTSATAGSRCDDAQVPRVCGVPNVEPGPRGSNRPLVLIQLVQEQRAPSERGDHRGSAHDQGQSEQLQVFGSEDPKLM